MSLKVVRFLTLCACACDELCEGVTALTGAAGVTVGGNTIVIVVMAAVILPIVRLVAGTTGMMAAGAVAEAARIALPGVGITAMSATGATAHHSDAGKRGELFGAATTTGLATAVAAMTTGSVIAAVAEMVELLLLV